MSDSVVRRITAIALVITAPAVTAAQTQTGFLDRQVTVGGQSYLYQLYVPAAYTPARRWPVVLFLHGAGERGTDGLRPTHVGLGPALRKNAERFPAIVLFPQAPADSLWVGASARMAIAALDQTAREFQTDPDRLYLTGISMGGNGVWYLAYRHPSRFAALLPICGWVTPFPALTSPVESVVPPDSGPAFAALARKLRDVPTWIVHGEIDDVVPVDQSRQAAEALKQAGAPMQYLELPGTEHNSWDATYASPRIMGWLFAQRRRR
jgi:predicted peptidase